MIYIQFRSRKNLFFQNDEFQRVFWKLVNILGHLKGGNGIYDMRRWTPYSYTFIKVTFK